MRFRDVLELILQLPDPQSRFYAALQKEENEDLFILLFGPPESSEDGGDQGVEDGEESDEEDAPASSKKAEALAQAPPYQHVSMDTYLTMGLLDEIRRLRMEHAVKGTGKRPKRVKPVPRPLLAKDRIESRQANKEIDEFARDLGFLK